MLVLDIRTPDEYADGHVCDAVLVPTPTPPLSELELEVLKAGLRAVAAERPPEPVYVYCKKGVRARVAVEILRGLGVSATSIGGVEREPLPSMLRGGELAWCA